MSTPLWAERRFGSTCVVEGCGALIPKGKRKCILHLAKGGYKVTQGRPSRKGANATGIAAHKPDRSRTRKAKRQNYEATGQVPQSLRAVRMNPARANATKKDRESW